MVAQKKGGAAGKQKQTKAQTPKPKSAKLFEEEFEMDDDDFDDDDAEMDSDLSDSNEVPQTGKKTANAGAKTPATRSAKKDVHVSFQLQDKTPTGQKSAQKLRTPTPMVPKNKQAQNLREQTMKRGMIGSPALKEFEGMKNAEGKNNATGAKGMKRKSAEDDDDEEEDDDEDDDDFEDDDDLDDDDLDEEEDDDEEDDEDDEDLDSDEEKAIVKKAKAVLERKGAQKGQKQEASPKKEQPKSAQKTPAKKQQNNQKQGSPSPAKAVVEKKHSETVKEGLEAEHLKRVERDLRSLFIKGIPADSKEEELKALSPDILSVRLPHRQKKLKHGFFAFFEFANEDKAEENFKILQSKTFRGQVLTIDYAGTKSKNLEHAGSLPSKDDKHKNLKKLIVMGMSGMTTINQVANIFPKANSITLTDSADYKISAVSFQSEDAAAEAMKANTNVRVNGRLLTVLYAVEGKNRSKSKNKPRRRNKNQGLATFGPRGAKSGPPAKKMKKDVDDDDDD